MRPKIDRPPTCRWCGKQPEFQAEEAQHAKQCLGCGALQDPILSLRNPFTGVGVLFWVNPDSGVYVEFEKKDGATDRYVLTPEKLRSIGALQSFSGPLNGKRGS